MTSNEALLLAGMMLVTFATRYPVLAILSKAPLPDAIFRALKYVPPAVLAAIIVPEVLLRDGAMDVSYTNAPLVASLVAFIVSWRTKNLLLTIIIGMGALWLWRWLVGG
jgi:branched-subunit amino acid transport protein